LVLVFAKMGALFPATGGLYILASVESLFSLWAVMGAGPHIVSFVMLFILLNIPI